MTLILILKSVIVVLFLLMFLRRPRVASAVGLLTVTSAVLLDTFLGTFGRDETIAELGFFFYIISGGLFGGAAVWTWGILRPLTAADPTMPRVLVPLPVQHSEERLPAENYPTPDATEPPTPYDRQMLYEEIRQRLGREDILDLLFDLGISDNDVMSVNQDMNQLIVRLMDVAAERGQTGALALAVERILTPMPPEHLPRLEKIDASSPPTILRHYLLAHFDVTGLRQIASELGIDWEQLSIGNKKELARNMLLYLYRRNRVGELVDLMHGEAFVEEPEST